MKKLLSPKVVLIAVALVFFYLTAWVGTPPGNIWNSPDETANAFWSQRVADRDPLIVREELVGFGAGVVHPRSFAVYGDALLPGSFPGLILLYGSLKFFTTLPFSVMTPLLTVLAGLVLYSLLKKLFDSRVAFWSAILFFLHPAVIYYSARGMFHNVLFIDLLIFSAGMFVLKPMERLYGKKHWLDSFFAGVLFGLALMTRTSEAGWVILASLAFLPFLKKNRWRSVAVVIIGALLPTFIYMSLNSSLFGEPFRTGYNPPPSSIEVSDIAIPAVVAEVAAPGSILPFGFHPRLVFLHGYDYGLMIFWWFTAAGLLGAVVFISRWKRHDKKLKTYFWVTAIIGAWLAVFYGSWFIRDHYDPTRVTIGTSYVRYFLPVYVLTLPWVAGGLIWLSKKITDRKWFLPALVIIFAVLSFKVSITNGDESMLAVRNTLRQNLEKRRILKQYIPPGSVVITEKFDKVIFPDRKLIIPVISESSWLTATELMGYQNVFVYGLDFSEDELKNIRSILRAKEVEILFVDNPFPGESLYSLKTFHEIGIVY